MNREKKSEFIRKSILNAAGVLFTQNGFEKTKVDDIAKKADLSKATFYAYFKSKDELLDTMLLLQLKEVNSDVKKLIDEHIGKRNCFIAICKMFVEVSRKNPVCYRRMLDYFGISYDSSTPKLYQSILEEARTLNNTLYDAMKKYGLTKLFDENSPDKAVFYLWTSVTGIISIAQRKGALINALYGISGDEFLNFAFTQLYKSATNEE